ncbi:Resolvase domain protein [Rhodopirellula sp. SWK7]|nr:Resolvase domain protein [Rhodopirellula sp. SWK7]
MAKYPFRSIGHTAVCILCWIWYTPPADAGWSNSLLAQLRATFVAKSDDGSNQMLRKKFDFTIVRDVVIYGRMSSDNQSKSSPAQQERAIRKLIKSRGLPWRVVKVYVDEAKSGKTAQHRPGFQQMLRDIKSGVVKASVILVDTIERFGRMDNLDSYRRDLQYRHGVYVLTADRNFADPNSVDSKYAEVFENMRAREDSRIKANDVYRGKIEAIEAGYWPGSPVPFGYKLEVVATEKRRSREIFHHKLVHDPETAPIMEVLFRASAENPSWGQQRLTRFLNDHEAIPERFKPFHADTIGHRLRSEIYRGTLVWSENATGLIDERRVIEKNDEEHVIRVEQFCEPIVDAETLEKVDLGIVARSRTRQEDANTVSRGTNYRYPLTGLVRCGHCGASMVPNSTAPYQTKSGETKTYCSYACPNQRNGICENGKRVKEEWLRDSVVGKVVERLLPNDSDFSSLVAEVQKLVEQQRRKDDSQRAGIVPQLQSELNDLRGRVSGWSVTLSKADLPNQLRDAVESQAGQALQRISEIEADLESQECEDAVIDRLVDPREVRERLDRLAEVLDGECATLANLELSMHIDRIDCFTDGRVVCRSCKIGSIPDAVLWFSQTKELLEPNRDSDGSGYQTKARRRAWMQVEDNSFTDERLRDRINLATDPHRFDSLPRDWFWVDEFQIPEPTCWSRENAEAVMARFQELQASGRKPSLNAIAKEFGVSRPTITRALDLAISDDDEPAKHRREPTVSVKGNAEVEAEIARLHDSGMLNKDIGKTLNISRSTVTNALDRIYEQRGLPRPDGRSTRHQ